MHRDHGNCRASADSKFGFEFETLHYWAALVEIDAHETAVDGGEPQLSVSQSNPVI